MLHRLFVVVMFVWAASGQASADVQQISWGDLLPDIAPVAHPLTGVDPSIREDLAQVARVEIDIAQGFLTKDSDKARDTQAMIQARLAEGVDLRALEQGVQAYQAELDRRQGLMSEALEGQLIKMPGYALPLEFTGTGATELFLVPYVGACIHVPPPPPNQIVSITLDEPLKLAGIFDPVWVTGRLIIEQSTQSLSLIDGSADIPYGYRLTDVTIEPYK